MDIFCEQIIKRKMSGKDIAIMAAAMVGALLVLTLTMMIKELIMFGLLILVGICVGLYYIITSLDWEFEYSITNGDFTCDKIIHRRKRKRQFSIDLHDVEEVGQYDAQKLAGRHFDATYQVGVTAGGAGGEWYLTGHFDKYGTALVVFSPDERVMNAVRTSLKRTVDVSALPKVQQHK
ncbi:MULTISPECIES: DUF6106 family protein [Caproicibacterium]|uniref:DUF6106 family protein n=1 Tax=Caproicibacterium argilliputei TaxID=3030016 RepID=A0AA97D5Z0_9FIRM|nr:DUF6106 family protein [Caproicibacterium argilliputei]WOC31205.1 DUF6106 family protein [Caproicibacterium argilliputei]